MGDIHYINDDIAIVGWACRFPGANNTEEFWDLMARGRCTVTRVPADRFSLERFGHPRRQERGRSYTWAAGVLDNVWQFDPGVFGISPREAIQMDPQQRLLLELTWEALEDAGIRPSTIAAKDVGVYVGASQIDYAHTFVTDQAIADSHFATGTALAILANRISYIFDLRGPSVTVDTACSSSLVALHQAVEALRSGRIDTAIVGGTNVITSPASFIAFSQASMLSPTGLCQAFSSKADGFVRAEGGGVIVLRRLAQAQAARNPVHGFVLATDVNSDGRTSGISLPSFEAQHALLERIYGENGVDPNRLAFVEAHGTGTAAGDPIEATALGRGLGQRRAAPLPIGSVKTNIGHLEPGAGIAGLIKAVLALNHGVLPPSLHCDELNPQIPFDDLNLQVCREEMPLAKMDDLAGVNSFGFGGTNAHAVVAGGKANNNRTSVAPRMSAAHPGLFAISAETAPALASLAQSYADTVAGLSDKDTAIVAAAAAHRREQLAHRLVVAARGGPEIARALRAFGADTDDPGLTAGHAVGRNLPVAFVYAGNGSQWVGMGRTAHRSNAMFRAHFDRVDDVFRKLSGWSLRELLFSDKLAGKLPLTSVAQPLIFAIQSATTAALTSRGITPACVLGHSVGEIAAAEAAGILDLETAIRLVYIRSQHQERMCGTGRMVALRATPETVQEMLQAFPEVEIAAFNSPRSLTLAGPADKLAALSTANPGVAMVDLDLDYPFHTGLLAPIKQGLIADLRDIGGHAGHTPFISTATGELESGEAMDGAYWWRNVREPVQLVKGVRKAASLGARFFLDIGARPTLLKHIADSLDSEFTGTAVQPTLDRKDEEGDPFCRIVAGALVAGAAIDMERLFGADPGPAVKLPLYPWQRREFRFEHSVESVTGAPIQHSFVGTRYSPDSLEWHAHIDTAMHPALQDHQVGEQVLFPGTAFLEIAFAVAREWLKSEQVVIADFEIMKALDLTKGETREIMSRVSPGSNVIEIFSRPRLSHAAWLQHCRGKMLHGNRQPQEEVPTAKAPAKILNQADVYRIASDAGLHYGPQFRLVQAMHVHDDVIDVRLDSAAAETPFVLDPVRADCCSHGVFAMFPDVQAKERGVAYIPVRIDRAAIYQPHVTPARALVEIHSKTSRAIVATYWILDRNGGVVAVFGGVRCQAVPVRHISQLETIAVVETPKLLDGGIVGATGIPASARQIVQAARAAGVALADDAPSPAIADLLDGIAMAAGYEIARSLADGDIVDPEQLVISGRIPPELCPWLVNLLVHLENAGLAGERQGAWSIVADTALPRADSLVKGLAVEYPGRGAELLLAGALIGLIRQMSGHRAIRSVEDVALPSASLDFYEAGNAFAENGRALVERVFRTLSGFWPRDRALRVLQLGYGPLTHLLASTSLAVDLTVVEPDRLAFDRAQAAFGKDVSVHIRSDLDGIAAGQFDAVLAVDRLHRLVPDIEVSRLREALAPNGMLIAVEAEPSLFWDMAFGLNPAWFADSDRLVGRLQPASSWREVFADFAEVETLRVACGAEPATLLVATVGASADAAPAAMPPSCMVSLRGAAATPLAAAILRDFAAAGVDVPVVSDVGHLQGAVDRAIIVTALPASGTLDSETALLRRCLDLKSLATAIAGSKATVWLVFSGALGVDGATVNPIEAGAWSFSRTLANEFASLNIHRIDVAEKTPLADAARIIRRIVQSRTDETELHIDGVAVRAVRVTGLKPVIEQMPRVEPAAARLQRRRGSGQRLFWESASRTRPGPNEVEIAVEATGLNFRDLMWTLSLLPDDMLEDGFTGPTLGLECAGRVARVGSAVSGLQVGDPVVALAASAFATHAVVPAARVAKVPRGLSIEAAATIPVAFLTAYYALIKLARLERGEMVLIHGGAGAVGMAAIQIAQWRGAKIVATAGSPAKRSLLTALGVEHVLDSRSTTFVEAVRRIAPNGVDVVLNSLAGEAMEMSIGCLGPFGRFIELGKRDYVTNTHIGLRPFRRNLSYFGVDLDQLVVGREMVGEALLQEVMALFEERAFAPLPYSVFSGANVAEAFHLMQQSSHIGKIVVKPAPASMAQPAPAAWTVKDGTHVITGAFGGFGAEVARWLVDQGARHLVLIGRKGADRPEAKSLVRELMARGVTVLSDPCDIADLRAVEALFGKIHATMPPVVGIMHAAMVLDDAILANLSEERFRRVLAPKVRGAENLDLVTRGLPVDYFVLFSSVTTLIGNPGQANYVAANAFMEGLARRRRQMGLPALAVGWGPITDVGVVATSDRLRSNLEKLTGVKGLRARDALDLLAQALALPAKATAIAAMTISPNDGNFSKERLPILRSPTYVSFVRGEAVADGAGNTVDLRALLQQEPMDAVRRKVSDIVVRNLAKVLHARPEDISRVRPLGEIGLDSLMTLELVMDLEAAFGFNVSLVSSVGTLTVSALADEIVAQVALDQDRDETAMADMASRHVAAMPAEAVAALKDIASSDGRHAAGRTS